jgi:hypothetical protein
VTVNQTKADIHDSTTCTLGPDGGPCELCAWAEGSRVDAAELLRDIRQDRQYASVSVVRMAIADVVDIGEAGLPWTFFPDDESASQTDHRARFIDAVAQRITQLQAPPHNLDAGLRERLTERAKEKR